MYIYMHLEASMAENVIDTLGMVDFDLQTKSGIDLECEIGAALLMQSKTLSVEVMENTLHCKPVGTQCITEGGDVHPALCIFPYNYKGRHYKGCTDSPEPSK
jgi:hypothetical protein